MARHLENLLAGRPPKIELKLDSLLEFPFRLISLLESQANQISDRNDRLRTGFDSGEENFFRRRCEHVFSSVGFVSPDLTLPWRKWDAFVWKTGTHKAEIIARALFGLWLFDSAVRRRRSDCVVVHL